MQKIKANIANDAWVFPYLKTYKGLLALILLLGFLTVFCGGALMFISGFLISRAAQRPENILMIYVPIVLTRAFGIGRPAFRYVQRLVSHNWVMRIVSKFRQRLYQLVERGTKSIHAKAQTGDVLNLLANDLDKIENFYLRMLFPTLIGFVVYLALVIGVGVFNIGVALLMLILLGLLTIVAPLITIAINGARDYRKKQQETELYIDLTDAVLGLQDWILADRTAELVQTQTTQLAKIHQLAGQKARFTWWRMFLSELVIGLAAILLIWFATNEFGASAFGVNWIGAFGLLIFPLSDTFISIATGAEDMPRYTDSIERLNGLSDQADAEASLVTQIAQLDDTTIEFKELSYGYTADRSILKHFNLQIQPGTKLAILGKSGAGKTTLLKLLLGDETPQSGRVTIGAVPIQQLQAHRNQFIAVLDQAPYLFASTVANNLRLGKLTATPAELWQVLDQVELGDLVRELPAGLATPMTEMGNRFSGGERQRFALARILLQDTPIVVLDEPTVGLDPITEQLVLQTIYKVLANKTVIWVTHHLTGIELVDKIIFIENQQIALAGTFDELMTSSPRFANLLTMDHGDIQ
ncbi:MAG: thiol reductant ABC exporter subunit CydC [Lactobacillaceae bacterium]|jgi:ATP-binding cassette subfamily C protein CydC|nr:thiol reductant ABC exporter subunit CydC [Lactobacillaceae bacterium]